MTIKYGVVGVGHLGRFHAMQAKNVTNCELVGIFDLNRERAEEISKELNVPFFNTLEELMNVVDAVSLVTITSTHYEIAKSLITNKIHVLIEKPITKTVEEADELIELAKTNDVLIQVGHIERFNGALQAIKEYELNPLFIESHRLSLFNVRGTDVAVILDLMIHDIDLILNLVKSKVKSINASGMSILSDSEDIANCRIEFENGCIANITASRISANKMRKMRIFQKNSYLSIDFDSASTDFYSIDESYAWDSDLDFSLGDVENASNKRKIKYKKFNTEGINPLKEEISSFVTSILNGSKAIVSGEDGRNALDVAEQIIKQIKEYQNKVS